MECIYIKRESDLERLKEGVRNFESFSNEDLIIVYNKQSKCGITGVHSQALYLMSLGHAFFIRIGKSPIYMENNVLGIRGQIKLCGETFEYVE